jgi:hypothetical protein
LSIKRIGGINTRLPESRQNACGYPTIAEPVYVATDGQKGSYDGSTDQYCPKGQSVFNACMSIHSIKHRRYFLFAQIVISAFGRTENKSSLMLEPELVPLIA